MYEMVGKLGKFPSVVLPIWEDKRLGRNVALCCLFLALLCCVGFGLVYKAIYKTATQYFYGVGIPVGLKCSKPFLSAKLISK